MISPIDLGWLAAIMEGEGSFYASQKSTSPVIYLGMTDLDVVEHAHRLFGAATTIGKIHRHKRLPHHKNTKPLYRFEFGGAAAASWMMTLYALLGLRRRARIRELLTRWRAAPFSKKDWVVCPRGHEYSISDTRLRRRACLHCAALRRAAVSSDDREARRVYMRNWQRVWRHKNPEKVRHAYREWQKRRLARALLEAV